jgi:hypothetical protein
MYVILYTDTTLCDKVCQLLAAGRWFSQRTSVSFTYKTYHHDITEILLKVALNTITLTPRIKQVNSFYAFLPITILSVIVKFVITQTTSCHFFSAVHIKYNFIADWHICQAIIL